MNLIPRPDIAAARQAYQEALDEGLDEDDARDQAADAYDGYGDWRNDQDEDL